MIIVFDLFTLYEHLFTTLITYLKQDKALKLTLEIKEVQY